MRIIIILFSLLLLVLCAAKISGPFMNVERMFLLVLMPKKFVELSVNDAITHEKETNKSFKERFEMDENYRIERINEFKIQFSTTTANLRMNIINAYIFVVSILLTAFVLALIVKIYVFISGEWIAVLQVISAFLILWSVLGQLGLSIQTFDGTSLPEQINDYFYKFLNCIGMGLLFFCFFYQIFSIPQTVETGKLFVKGESLERMTITAGILFVFIKCWEWLKSHLFSRKRTQAPCLSQDDIVKRLQIRNEKIVNEIYDICKNQLSDETKRRSNIDSKANNLAGMIGIYLSVMYGLKGAPFNNILAEPLPFFIYLFVCISAAIALICALFAARARSDLKKVAEQDVLNAQITKGSIKAYKQYMAAHYWFVYRNNHSVNEKKGGALKLAYFFFVAAVIALTVLTIMNVINYRKQQEDSMTEIKSDNKPDKIVLPSDGDLETGAKNAKKTMKPSSGDKLTESKD